MWRTHSAPSLISSCATSPAVSRGYWFTRTTPWSVVDWRECSCSTMIKTRHPRHTNLLLMFYIPLLYMGCMGLYDSFPLCYSLYQFYTLLVLYLLQSLSYVCLLCPWNMLMYYLCPSYKNSCSTSGFCFNQRYLKCPQWHVHVHVYIEHFYAHSEFSLKTKLCFWKCTLLQIHFYVIFKTLWLVFQGTHVAPAKANHDRQHKKWSLSALLFWSHHTEHINRRNN